MAAAATRGLPRPVALAPKLGKLFDADPLFTWRYKGKGKSFVFILLDDSQGEIYHTELIGTAYSYPPSAPQLEPGKTFFWTVCASSTIYGGEPSAPAGFIVLSRSQQEVIEKTLAQIPRDDPYQAGLARAELFTNHRLWYDTLDVYADLVRQYPDRADLYARRGMIYAQLGVTQELAEQDFARTDELEASKSR